MPASSNGVRQLQAKLLAKQKEMEAKKAERDKGEAEYHAAWAEFNALNDAYNLVKPQPRVRKAKTAKKGEAKAS